MIVGFTGTRSGMTTEQKERVRTLLLWFVDEIPTKSPSAITLVHGDCVGADADAHEIARSLDMLVEIRPCDFPGMRAHCEGATFVHPVTTPFARNRAIVEVSHRMIATPATAEEQPRGGTWYTIKYSKKKGRRTYVVHPNGAYELYPSAEEVRE
jgi:DUF438 domain-containing protein